MTSLADIGRRLRYGAPVVVVSGLPRSGTSMAMKMLEAGGFPVLTDGIRTADDHNPNGYYEFERVKALDKGDTVWLGEARGKAVKIISMLLPWLPETYHYQVIFMERDLSEALVSQNTMLGSRGGPIDSGGDARLSESYREHLAKVARFMANRRCFSTLYLQHRDAVERPLETARRISTFVGGRLNESAMASVVDQRLYRNRASVASCGQSS